MSGELERAVERERRDAEVVISGLDDEMLRAAFRCSMAGTRWQRLLAGEIARRQSPPPPPDDGTCRDCYEWRRYAPPQEHFGFAWWRTCGHDCTHAHHADEVWLG